MNAQDIPVKFFDDMESMTGSLAECIVYIPEIHVDSKYRESKRLPEMLQHERHHYELLVKLIEEKNGVRGFFIGRYNNLWDFCSTLRLSLKWFLHGI
jgi:hypothetical protein